MNWWIIPTTRSALEKFPRIYHFGDSQTFSSANIWIWPRSLHWTWVKNPIAGKWLQFEQAWLGKPKKFKIYYCIMIVLFHHPEINMVFGTISSISPAEKNMVFRAHVNLGHPSVKEFVRFLKAIGIRTISSILSSGNFNVRIILKSKNNLQDCQCRRQEYTTSTLWLALIFSLCMVLLHERNIQSWPVAPFSVRAFCTISSSSGPLKV